MLNFGDLTRTCLDTHPLHSTYIDRSIERWKDNNLELRDVAETGSDNPVPEPGDGVTGLTHLLHFVTGPRIYIIYP